MRPVLQIPLMFGLWLATRTIAADALDDLLACNAAALGGDAAFEAVNNLRIELDIREPTFEVRGDYVASREGFMRIDIYAGEQRVFAEGLNAGGAWQWTPDSGLKASAAAAAAALRNGIEAPGRFWTLQQLRARGLRIELLEDAALAKGGEWQLRMTRPDGSSFDYFIARETCLPTREVSQRAFHPDVDPTEVPVETAFSEPFTVDGVTRFRRGESRRLDTGEWLGTTALLNLGHDIEPGAAVFDAR